jgi:hypothetical protein
MAINSDHYARDREILSALLKTIRLRPATSPIGIYDRLVGAGVLPTVCMAGGLFGLYPTPEAPDNNADRDKVRQLCGSQEAEGLAYVFSTVDRPDSLECGEPVHWQTGKPIKILESSHHDLNLIEAARLLENGQSLAPYRHIHMTWRRYSK